MVESTEISLELIIVAGTAGMLLLVVFIVIYMVLYQRKITKQREAQLEAVIQTQEEERKRIAADLHDDIQQQFAAVTMMVKRASGKLGSGSEVSALLDDAASMADEAIAGTRRISHDLLSPTLKKLGLAQALDELCVRLNNDRMQAEFTVHGEYQRLDTRTELSLYRVAQELVSNTLKYAEATRFEIVMNCAAGADQNKAGRFILMISDNGKGFDVEKEKDKGLGMRNIESRLSMIGATYHFESQPGEGTSVTIVLETINK